MAQSKPDVGVYVLGGTLTCGHVFKEGDQFIEKKPIPMKVLDMITRGVDPATRAKVGNILYKEAPSLMDSGQYTMQDIQNAVRDIRALLSAHRGLSWMVPMGTDNAAAMMQALAEGIPPDILNDGMILGLATNDYAELQPGENYSAAKHDPVRVLTDGLYIIAEKRHILKGHIGLLTPFNLYSPRGLAKAAMEGRKNFLTRFSTFGDATGNADYPHWGFDPLPRVCNLPRGGPDDLLLAHAIQSWDLGVGSEYETFLDGMKGILERPWKWDPRSGLSGIVLMTPAGSFRMSDRSALSQLAEGIELAAEHGVPAVHVAKPVQHVYTPYDAHPSPDLPAYYTGHFASVKAELDRLLDTGQSSIIDGGDMSEMEAKIMVAKIVARARVQIGLIGRDVVIYAASKLEEYLNEIDG